MRARAGSVKFNDLYHIHQLDTDLGDLSKTTFRDFIKEADYHGTELPSLTELEADMLAVKALWTKDTSDYARLGFTLMRDWCMIGSVGLELLRREIGKPERPLNVVTNAGVGHIGKSRKARTLGLEVVARYLQPERTKSVQPIANVSAKVARTGIVSPYEAKLVSSGF